MVKIRQAAPGTSGAPRRLRRSVSVGLAGVLLATLAGCTGRGGGQLPPDGAAFTGRASFGFQFSCEDKGGINPPTGQLRIQLSYNEHGANLLGSPFAIHGIVDQIDPVLESAVCIGQNPPPGGKELIFLGRYRPTTSPPAGFPKSCPAKEKKSAPLCRFEVIVRDNDDNYAPSRGDFFQIQLSSSTAACVDPSCSELPVGTVFYTRAGVLEAGNITVK